MIGSVFKKKLYIHTSKGERVIALACKQININVVNYDKIPREKLETNMYFLGFVTIRNKIKENVKETINILKSADYKMIMSTGDNLLTAISVSKECGIIPSDKVMYSVDIDNNNKLQINLIENYSDFHKLEFEDIKNLIKEGKVTD